jgi:hypothetical protein
MVGLAWDAAASSGRIRKMVKTPFENEVGRGSQK